MATEVGSAYVTLIPSAKGFAAKMQAELAGDVAKVGKSIGDDLGESVGDGGKTAGSRFADRFKGVAGKALGAASGLLIGATIGSSIASGFSAKDMNAKLTAQLGLTEQESARVGKVAGSLFGQNYGTGTEQINEALHSVISNIDGMRGASEKTLSSISGKVLNTANIFDQDLGGVTRAVGQMLRTGLAKNATQALNIITTGFQNGADKSEDFLDTLNEYGTQFRKLGINGQTATGLISQGLKAGARDGDLVADSIKEFSIRAVDGSKTTAQGFKAIGLDAEKMAAQIGKGGPAAQKGLDTVLDRLRKMKDPVAQSAAAVNLFGTQAEDMGKALFALDPSKATKGLGKVAGAADRAGQAFNDTPTAKLQAFTRQLQQGLTNAVVKYVIPAFNAVAPVLSDLGSKLSTVTAFVAANKTAFSILGGALAVLTGITMAHAAAMAISNGTLKAWFLGTKLVTAATKAWAAVQWVLDAALNANPLGIAVVALAALVGGIILAWKHSDRFRAVVTAAFGAVKSVVGAVASWFTTAVPAAFHTVVSAVSSVLGWVRSNWPLILAFLTGPIGLAVLAIAKNWDKIKAGATALVGWFGGLPGKIGGALRALGGVVSRVFSTAWSAVRDTTTRATANLVGFVRALPGRIVAALRSLGALERAAFTAAWNAARAAVQAGISAVINVVSRGVANIGHAFSAVKAKVTGAFSGAGSWLTSIGENIVRGLGAGIDKMVGWVKGKIDALADMMPKWLRKKLGISSPSKVFADLAKWIPLGIAQGIDDGSSGATAALDQLGTALEKRVKKLVPGKRVDAVVKRITKGYADTAKLLKTQAGLIDAKTTELNNATQALQQAQSTMASYSSGIAQGIAATGNITGLGAADSETMIDRLTAKLETAQKWAGMIAELTRRKLGTAALDQLLQAGPEQGMAAAQALLDGGQVAIDKVRLLVKQITDQGVTLGDAAGQTMYGAGVRAAQQVVNGLTADMAGLQAAARRIASVLVNEINAAVGKLGGGKGGKKHGKKTPRYASGTTNFAGGLAVVGEEGPELVALPRGASVIPADLTRAALTSSPVIGSEAPTVANVRVFIGERELTDIVRVQVDEAQVAQARQLVYGRRS